MQTNLVESKFCDVVFARSEAIEYTASPDPLSSNLFHYWGCSIRSNFKFEADGTSMVPQLCQASHGILHREYKGSQVYQSK